MYSSEDKEKIEETNRRNEESYGLLEALFSRGNVQIRPDQMQSNSRRIILKLVDIKKLLLIAAICALSLTAVFIIRQMTAKSQELVNTSEEKKAMNERLVNNSIVENLIISGEQEVSDMSTQSTTTMTTTQSTTQTTTMTTTPVKTVDYMLATIVINRAIVPNKDYTVFSSKTDGYVKAYIDNSYIGETPRHKNTLYPTWNYQIAHRMTVKADTVIQFALYDHDLYNEDELIDRFVVKMSDLMAEEANGKIVNRYFNGGRLWFTVTWTEVYKSH